MKIFLHIGILLVALLTACKSTEKVTQVSEETETVDLDTFVIHADPQPVEYKGSEKRVCDLLHMRLDVSFDWDSSFVNGHAVLDFKPYNRPVSEVTLDARGFRITGIMAGKKDSLVETTYRYDNEKLSVDLGQTFSGDEQFQVSVKYTAMPSRLRNKAGVAITSDRGLYFIKPDTSDKSSWQIWSQGETEANSAWFPTIDAPNERMTQEILITVDTMYETLSNGILLFETENRDGTKTAYWRMDKSHAPYLVMIAVGDYAIVRDQWRNTEVSYYVYKSHEQYAMSIFGNTPKMMEFFSTKLGVDYPWPKFSQIAVKDFVSGAMENTTAVVHGDFIMQTDRERLDRDYEDYISHELFHQWFGDLVTCESWAQLPLNESFATYGEYLWIEYSEGPDAAGHHLYNDLRSYLTEAAAYPKKMIRFDYRDANDMFDRHSYQKGGLILHMLREYLGDDIFFTSLTRYLKAYAFRSVEIHQLRRVFEEVSGEDLNWFFDQWFFEAGHPDLEISWKYDTAAAKVKLNIRQKQDFSRFPLYRLPVKVDLYVNGKKESKDIIVTRTEEEFEFNAAMRPDLVNFDAEKMLVCTKNDIKPVSEWSFMYRNAPGFIDRYEALQAIISNTDSVSREIVTAAMNDPFWKIREKAVKGITSAIEYDKDRLKDMLIQLSQNDESSLVRAASIDALAKNYTDANLIGLYAASINDSSYEVIESSLNALVLRDEQKGMQVAKKLEGETNGNILRIIADLYSRKGEASESEFFLNARGRITNFNRFSFINAYSGYLKRQNDQVVSKGVNALTDIGKHEETWWIRLAAVTAIKELKEKYEERSEVTRQKLGSLKEDNPNKEIYEKMLLSSDQMIEQIKSSIAELKKGEDNEKILKVLEG